MQTALAYAIIYLIWGSTFLAIRIAVGSIPPLLMMGVRCVTAGGLLLSWAALRRERVPRPAWGHAAIAGALMFTCAYGALAWAEQRMASGVAALVVATVPFWFTAFEWVQSGRRPSPRTLIGVAIGFAGVALLVVDSAGGRAPVVPVIVVALGEIAWVAGSLYARPPRLPTSVALNAGMPLTAGGALLIIASWISGELGAFEMRDVSAGSLGALAYLIGFGSIAGLTAYAWLMQVAPAWRVGTHAYVNPVVAVVLGSSLGGEPLTAALVVATVVIAAGVAMILSDHMPRTPARRSVWQPVASQLRAKVTRPT